LNIIKKDYFFRIGAIIDVWVYESEYGDGLNATATIGSQVKHTKANTSAARLFNITKEITSITLNASDYGTETQSISITESYHNLSFNMTESSALKMYFYDEKSEALIEGETFSVYLETTGFSDTYSATINPYTIRSLDS